MPTIGSVTSVERVRPALVILSPTLLRLAPTPCIAALASSTSLRIIESVVLEPPMRVLYLAVCVLSFGSQQLHEHRNKPCRLRQVCFVIPVHLATEYHDELGGPFYDAGAKISVPGSPYFVGI